MLNTIRLVSPKATALLIALCTIGLGSFATGAKVKSAVYEWNDLEVQHNGSNEIRRVLNGSTDGFKSLEIYTNSLSVDETAGDVQVDEGIEQLIIIKRGSLDLEINGYSRKLGPGSIAVILPGDEYQIGNAGSISATYFVLQWRIKNTQDPLDASASSEMINWTDVEFKVSAKGGRRNIIRQPTAMLAEFEMHTTTLDEGMKSHDPHTHVEEEIILVRYGQVEEMIDGSPYPAGPGSVIFLGSNVPHGIRNIGDGPCEYYAFKWKLR